MIFLIFTIFVEMNNIHFFSADKAIPIKNRSATKRLLKKIFVLEEFQLNKISFIFCSDKYLLKINSQILKHNYYTDVITFALSLTGYPIVGEVYISIERIKENAKTYHTLYQNELLRVMIHGVLHLCGYTDKKRIEQDIMRKKEDLYLNLISNDLL